MKSKAKVPPLLRKFFALVENQFQIIIKIIRTDNGPEFNMADSMLLKVSFTDVLVSNPLNKLALLNVNTNTFLMLLDHYHFKLVTFKFWVIAY